MVDQLIQCTGGGVDTLDIVVVVFPEVAELLGAAHIEHLEINAAWGGDREKTAVPHWDSCNHADAGIRRIC